MASLARNTSVVLATAAALLLSLSALSPAASVEPAPPATRAWTATEPRLPAAPVDPVVEVAVELPTLAAPPAPTGPDWTIAIDTAGWQDELDLCLWVRMDFDGVVPMVGAHNFCGGSFILDLSAGQTVQLIGQGLDGTYVVTADRQVYSGDDAIAATSGLAADVILQTCYWDAASGMRLVALALLPA